MEYERQKLFAALERATDPYPDERPGTQAQTVPAPSHQEVATFSHLFQDLKQRCRQIEQRGVELAAVSDEPFKPLPPQEARRSPAPAAVPSGATAITAPATATATATATTAGSGEEKSHLADEAMRRCGYTCHPSTTTRPTYSFVMGNSPSVPSLPDASEPLPPRHATPPEATAPAPVPSPAADHPPLDAPAGVATPPGVSDVSGSDAPFAPTTPPPTLAPRPLSPLSRSPRRADAGSPPPAPQPQSPPPSSSGKVRGPAHTPRSHNTAEFIQALHNPRPLTREEAEGYLGVAHASNLAAQRLQPSSSTEEALSSCVKYAGRLQYTLRQAGAVDPASPGSAREQTTPVRSGNARAARRISPVSGKTRRCAKASTRNTPRTTSQTKAQSAPRSQHTEKEKKPVRS